MTNWWRFRYEDAIGLARTLVSMLMMVDIGWGSGAGGMGKRRARSANGARLSRVTGEGYGTGQEHLDKDSPTADEHFPKHQEPQCPGACSDFTAP